MRSALRQLVNLLALLVLCAFALQLYWLARVSLMAVVDPQSTSFQRSEAWRLLRRDGLHFGWRQHWRDDAAISVQLKRAVIASEDAGFVEHGGIEWESLEKIWEKNLRAQAQAERRNEMLGQRSARNGQPLPPTRRFEPKLVGGSTITQQLAKNLFFSAERTWARKAQEGVVTLMIEALLSKQRILEIYLNSVEWGEGVFGAQAAAQHYYRADAAVLSAAAAARLAVMLPAPKRFERNPGSVYVSDRSTTIEARMPAVDLP